MNQKLAGLLRNTAPMLFRECPELSVHDGWFVLLLDLAKELEVICRQQEAQGLPALMAVQVKTKYGGLRFYTRNGTDLSSRLIEAAEDRSECICELCGSPRGREVEIREWVWTLCPVHANTSKDQSDGFQATDE